MFAKLKNADIANKYKRNATNAVLKGQEIQRR